MDERDFRPSSSTSKDYSVDVTKPRETTTPSQSTATPSQPTAEELQEQRRLEALEKIKQNQSQRLKSSARSGVIKKVFIGVFAALLAGLVIALIVFMVMGTGDKEEAVYTRLSMVVNNTDMTYVVLETGEVILRPINPGDTLAISSMVRNSHEIGGDTINVAVPPPAIFVRFRVYLILDYEYRYDVIKLDYDEDLWYRYDEDYDYGEDDHYYYYMGSLVSQEAVDLFSALTFYGPSLTVEDGGKYGQIQIEVEAIEANFEFIRNDTAWLSRPDGWFDYMQNQFYS